MFSDKNGLYRNWLTLNQFLPQDLVRLILQLLQSEIERWKWVTVNSKLTISENGTRADAAKGHYSTVHSSTPLRLGFVYRHEFIFHTPHYGCSFLGLVPNLTESNGMNSDILSKLNVEYPILCLCQPTDIQRYGWTHDNLGLIGKGDSGSSVFLSQISFAVDGLGSQLENLAGLKVKMTVDLFNLRLGLKLEGRDAKTILEYQEISLPAHSYHVACYFSGSDEFPGFVKKIH